MLKKMSNLPKTQFKFEALEERLEMRWRVVLFGVVIYDSYDGWFPQF
jgi:hypothetical protein